MFHPSHGGGGGGGIGSSNTAFTAFLDANNVNMLWEVLSDELGISRAATADAAAIVLKRNVQQVFQRNLQLFAQQPPPLAPGGANNNSLLATSQYNRQFLAQVTQALRQLNVIGGNGAVSSTQQQQHPPPRRLTIGEELLPVTTAAQQSERNAAQFTADLEQKQREFEAFASPIRPAEIDFTQLAPPQQPMAPIDALMAGKLAERDLENAAFQQYNPTVAASASGSGSGSVSTPRQPLLPPELVPQETAIKARPPQQQQHVKWQDEQPQQAHSFFLSQPRGSIFDKLKPIPMPAAEAASGASEEKAKRGQELAEMQTRYEQPPKTTPPHLPPQPSPPPSLPTLAPETASVPKPPPPPPLLPFEEWAKQMNAMRDEMEQLKQRVAELESNLATATTPPSQSNHNTSANNSDNNGELDV